MQLEIYISDLLYRYECVTVPDFGAFLTQNTSSSIDSTTNTFYAPQKRVSFNEQIQKNDGLLAHYIADVEKISFEVATKKIAKRVKLLKSYLIQGETLKFSHVGEMVFNKEGKIIFEPSNKLNYLTDAFGLSQFVSPEVHRNTNEKTIQSTEKTAPIRLPREKHNAKPYLKYAAIALIALTLGGLSASRYYTNQIEEHNLFAQEVANKELDHKIQLATFNLNPLPTVTLNVTKETGNYHIMAGAFRIENNCNKLITKLRKNGFNARKIGVNAYGLHQVAYGSYKTGKEALKAIRSIRKTQNQDAWLLVKALD